MKVENKTFSVKVAIETNSAREINVASCGGCGGCSSCTVHEY